METVSQTVAALVCLVIWYILAKLIFRAYFAARREFIFQLVDKAKEIQRGKGQ